MLEAAARGDPAAVRALYDRFSRRVYTIARRLAGDDALAKDIAQEAWIRILRALPGFRGDARLSSWVHRIAVNTALLGSRRERRQGMREDAFASAPARPRAVTGQDERVLLRMQLEDALDDVPDGMRRVLVLHDVEGYTHEEIAAALGTTPSASRSQLTRARARLRAALER